METALSLAFMVFGLGFFLFVTLTIARDHRESQERRIMEAREFGQPRSSSSQRPKDPKE